MNGLNFQASVSNLTQMDRHQQDVHRTPVVNQEQNAEIARGEAAQRTARPVQPDRAEEKKIDPKQRGPGEENRKKKRNKKVDAVNGKSPDSGFFLDISV
jgi:hypothetical protein